MANEPIELDKLYEILEDIRGQSSYSNMCSVPLAIELIVLKLRERLGGAS